MGASKFMLGITSAAMVAAVVAPVSVGAKSVFSDIPGNSYAFNAINYGLEKGYISGITEDNFGYGKELTRRDAAVMIASAVYNGKVPEATSTFSDVQEDDYSSKYIAALQSLGIVGFEDGTFKPKETITRAEFAQMLVVAFDLGEADGAAKLYDVSDDYWAKSAIDTLVLYYDSEGTGEHMWSPENNVTREQAAQFVYSVEISPIVTDVTSITDTSVYVSFENSDVDTNKLRKSDFAIDGLDILSVKTAMYMNASGLQTHIVEITTSLQEAYKEYTLSYKGKEFDSSFTGGYQQIENTKALSDTQVQVDFSSPVTDITSGSFVITEIDNNTLQPTEDNLEVLDVKLSEDGKQAILTTEKQKEGAYYDVGLNDNLWGNFTGYVEGIYNIIPSGDNSIMFSVANVDDEYIKQENFTIEGLEIIDFTTTDILGEKMVSIVTSPQEMGKEYTISFLGKEYTFLGGIPFPDLVEAISSTEVVMTYSTSMSSVTAEDIEMYDAGTMAPVGIQDVGVSEDGLTITITTTTPLTPNTDYIVSCIDKTVLNGFTSLAE